MNMLDYGNIKLCSTDNSVGRCSLEPLCYNSLFLLSMQVEVFLNYSVSSIFYSFACRIGLVVYELKQLESHVSPGNSDF